MVRTRRQVRLQDNDDIGLGREAAWRMRALLASADEHEYQQAVQRLAGHRRTQAQKAVASYLVPERLDWLEECHEPHGDKYGVTWWLLRHAYSTPAQVAKAAVLFKGGCPMSLVVTLADACGTGALPLFVQALDEDLVDRTERRRLFQVIGLMPADEAFQVLIDRIDQKPAKSALFSAMARFPARATRLLAAAGATGPLTDHVRAHPEVVAAVLPDLPDEARAFVEAVIAADVRVAEADPADLPRFLVEPPWTRERKAAKPVVLTGLAPSTEQGLTWAPGEHVSSRPGYRLRATGPTPPCFRRSSCGAASGRCRSRRPGT